MTGMLLSAVFHLFKDISSKFHVFYAKFDYIGIVINIAGSATSPVYYATYC